MSSLIGNRYGEAFFEAGRDENCLDSLYEKLIAQFIDRVGE